jgi:hypothetical protein
MAITFLASRDSGIGTHAGSALLRNATSRTRWLSPCAPESHRLQVELLTLRKRASFNDHRHGRPLSPASPPAVNMMLVRFRETVESVELPVVEGVVGRSVERFSLSRPGYSSSSEGFMSYPPYPWGTTSIFSIADHKDPNAKRTKLCSLPSIPRSKRKC